jgi:hypothetical protein
MPRLVGVVGVDREREAQRLVDRHRVVEIGVTLKPSVFCWMRIASARLAPFTLIALMFGVCDWLMPLKKMLNELLFLTSVPNTPRLRFWLLSGPRSGVNGLRPVSDVAEHAIAHVHAHGPLPGCVMISTLTPPAA